MQENPQLTGLNIEIKALRNILNLDKKNVKKNNT